MTRRRFSGLLASVMGAQTFTGTVTIQSDDGTTFVFQVQGSPTTGCVSNSSIAESVKYAARHQGSVTLICDDSSYTGYTRGDGVSFQLNTLYSLIG